MYMKELHVCSYLVSLNSELCPALFLRHLYLIILSN